MSRRWSRWLLVSALSCAGCGSPDSPSSLTTSSIASTTTTVAAAPDSARYVGSITPPGLPPIPADMTLFFRLLSGATPITRSRFTVAAAALYEVTGGYSTGDRSFDGTIVGTLDGTPLDGVFNGVLTAKLASGCIAERHYTGPLTRNSISWSPAAIVNDCGGASPLTAVVALPASPLPPTTSIMTTVTTTSILATTTTSVPPTTTTTIPAPTTSSTSSTSTIQTTTSSSTTTTTTSPPTFSRCDFNQDGVVNEVDVDILLKAIPDGSPAIYDLNRDGAVDVLDLQLEVNVVLKVIACPA